MLDHLSHGLYTFPVFALVGRRERPLRPVAVDDVAQILEAAAHGDPRLMDRTIAVLGPDAMPLSTAVRRVAAVIKREPRYVRLPVAAHLVLARIFELTMKVPLLAVAQVHILAEGAAEPLPYAPPPPDDLAPQTPFDEESIRAGLPEPGRFGMRDLRWWPG
jgi:NADH dehydrogenase